MVEFIETFKLREIGVFTAPLLLLFFASLGGVGVLLNRIRYAKKIALPHTMSEKEYIRLNNKRFNGAGGTSAGYSSDCTGPR